MSIEVKARRGFVSATVASQLLGVSRQRTNQLLKAGKLHGAFLVDVGDGREQWVVPRRAIERVIEERNRPRPWAKKVAA